MDAQAVSAWEILLLVIYLGGAALYVSVADTRETMGLWIPEILGDRAGEERPPEVPRVPFLRKVLFGLLWPVRLLLAARRRA